MEFKLYTLEEDPLAMQNALLLEQSAPQFQEDVPLHQIDVPLLQGDAMALGQPMVDVPQLLEDQDQGQGQPYWPQPIKQKFKLDDNAKEFFEVPILASEAGLLDGKLFCCLPTYLLTCLPT